MTSSSEIARSAVSTQKKSTLRGNLKQTLESKRSASCSMVFFTVGGKEMAARMEEVAAIRPWGVVWPVPCGQSRVNGLIRYGDEVFPVFDLSGSLNVTVQGAQTYCLMARTPKGNLAVCIDSQIPSMQTLEAKAIQANPDPQSSFREVCLVGTKEIPVVSFAAI